MAASGLSSSSVVPSEGESGENIDSVYDLVKTKRWLEIQLMELKTQLAAARDEDLSISQDDDPTQTAESISKLQTELQDVSVNTALRALILSKAQHSQTLLKYLFPSQTVGDTVETPSGVMEKQKVLTELVEKQTKLASNILRMHEENQEKLQALNELKLKNIDRKQTLRELMYQIVKAKETSLDNEQGETEEVIRKRECVLGLEQKVELVRHTLQGLILGSGIHWAKDEHLRQLVLQLGRPISL